MASTAETAADADRRLRSVTATLSPTSRFEIPESDGYSVYSALLSTLSEVDEAVGQSVHDSPLGSLHNSGLFGSFRSSDRAHHKVLSPNNTYELSLGIVHPEDTAVFQALVNALVLEGQEIELSHGSLTVQQFESENASHEVLLDRAADMENPTVTVDFQTATCIEDAPEITTMFPHRVPVFTSLLGKWNATAPEKLELDLSREAIRTSVIEKPDARTYATHSVLTNRVKRDDGKNRNLFKQGFTGKVTYDFKDASEAVENAVAALALFGEYSGVGSAVARGCGCVEVSIE